MEATVEKKYSIEDIRTEVHKVLKKMWEEQNSWHVIVTYDCLEDSFRNYLRDDLLLKKYKAIKLGESNYHLKQKLTPDNIKDLVNDILDGYKNKVLNESKKPLDNSIVKLIFPNGKEFHVVDLELPKP